MNKNLRSTQEIIEKIKLDINNIDHGYMQDQLSLFADNIYKFSLVEDLVKKDISKLAKASVNLFEFIQHKPKDKYKVRVYNPNNTKHPYESQKTYIEILNKDMPFLVDSLSEEIKRHGLKIHDLYHPVVSVKRDKGGNLIEIETDYSNKDHLESVIQIQISKLPNAKMKSLEEDLMGILDNVKVAVSDWKSILQKVEKTIAQVQSYQLSEATGFDTSRKNLQEVEEFLRWLVNNNFVFLGYGEYIIEDGKAKVKEDSKLGIIKYNNPYESKNHHIKNPAKAHHIIDILKADAKSIIHRPVQMDYISIKNLDDNGKVLSEFRFIGLFTSAVYHQSVKNVPIIREKVKQIQKWSGFTEFGHRKKALTAILEDLPRDELLQSSVEELFDASMGIVMLNTQPKIRLFLREDDFKRYISCLVFIPRDIMSTNLRKKIEIVLASELKGSVTNHFTQINDANMARMQAVVQTDPNSNLEYNTREIEDKIVKISRRWTDALKDFALNKEGAERSETLFEKYNNAFSLSYQDRFSYEDGYYDILQSEKTLDQKKVVFDLYESTEGTSEILEFKVYTLNEQIRLSQIMPILDNMGLSTLDEQTYICQPKNENNDKVWIHRFRFILDGAEKPDLEKIQNNFESAVEKIWLGLVENDSLNKLILLANQQWRNVVILRAYCKYLHQSSFTYSKEFVYSALAKNPKLVKLIIELFHRRFDPEFKGSRDSSKKKLLSEVEAILDNVSDLAEDRVVRGLVELILATKRTNFFQKSNDGNDKDYISFKFSPKEISWLPEPKPHAEIFVYSARIEGVHLRGGKVARGGLRWSDRLEDFRTEVLGLMKAQMTKNSVIIPVGSKGGFVVKQTPKTGGREAFIAEGIECYKTFLRGLLDITDNMVDNKVVPPVQVFRHDEDDAYLVVAADKGTATFSDIANGISAEYNFWLGDAFASGGSAGYDHKKMGITAKGAWVSVKRHFSEMNLDVDSDDFTVIGIGDMGGDVFGNGMLCSKHIKLIGAFNHMHIFLDPNPNPAKSFEERKRLFELPRSSWLDYDKKLISQGGGVFLRSDKSIQLTPQIQEVLAIKDKELSPDDLIRKMLKAPVGLIWNGGIGTYVKAKSESHEDAGDKANDVLRINGNDLRANVVGEGGNLGFTQLGRIEYARNGGRINTDAIDNSAGVDCSDHEVNIKIVLEKAIADKALKKDKRNDLLESMTDEVADLCLRDNTLQTQAITIAQLQGNSILELLARKIEHLESKGLLNREIEFLPSKKEIDVLNAQKQGLTRPELSVLLAYSKIALFEDLVDSNLPDDEFYEDDLIRYFPKDLQKTYKAQINKHPLRREIIATSVTNSILNRIGSALYYHIQEDSGVSACDIARGYTIAREVFHLRDLWDKIESTKNIEVKHQNEIFVEIQKIAQRSTLWFLRHYPQPLQVKQAIKEFKTGVDSLSSCLVDLMPKNLVSDYKKRVETYKSYGLGADVADKIAKFIALSSACDIVNLAKDNKLSENISGKLYFDLGAKLNLEKTRKYIAQIKKNDYWEAISHDSLINEIYDQQTRLAARIISNLQGNDIEKALDNWLEQNKRQIERYNDFVKNLKSNDDNLGVSLVVIALRKLREIDSV